MKKFMILTISCCLVVPLLHAASNETIKISPEQVHAAFPAQTPPHPRLFVNDAQLPALKEHIASEPMLTALHAALRTYAESQLDKKPLERVLTGRRLLGVSRNCLQRVFLWSLCYRLDGDRRFLERAEREMLAAADFSDWNPSHFLDVAEMTAALAIGYDWLYNDLSETARVHIAAAILEKGLQPSLDRSQGLFRGNNNWSQVCNGGITLGALAVMEDHPEKAEKSSIGPSTGYRSSCVNTTPTALIPKARGIGTTAPATTCCCWRGWIRYWARTSACPN